LNVDEDTYGLEKDEGAQQTPAINNLDLVPQVELKKLRCPLNALQLEVFKSRVSPLSINDKDIQYICTKVTESILEFDIIIQYLPDDNN